MSVIDFMLLDVDVVRGMVQRFTEFAVVW